MKVQYGWVIVAIGALMSCASVGAMMSLAVFLQPITQATGWTRAAVSAWLPNRRSLAVSLVSAGIGVAPMTVSPFAAWLLANTDWRGAQLTIGVAVWLLLIPAALLVRPAPRGEAHGAGADTAGER